MDLLRFPWVITHGWGPATATRFIWKYYGYRGLKPTAGFLPPLRGSYGFITFPVGYHPRMGACHRYAVHMEILRFPWVETHGWIPATANAVHMVIFRFPWVVTHGWIPVTANAVSLGMNN